MSEAAGLFDSHCHLTDAAFREDREAVLVHAARAGVKGLVTIASDVVDAGAALALVRAWGGDSGGERPRMWCSVGVHPHEAAAAGPDALARVHALAGEAEVVALGETGLDYHYDYSPRDVQRRLFEAHLALGTELSLPVVVHARDADEDVAAALRAAPPETRGVLHCFTGGERAFTAAMERGWYVSFSGIASFRSFQVAELLREVPPERLLVETDSPYLAPVPLRGKRNEPAFVRHVAEAVAAHLGEELDTVAARTTANAKRFYGLDHM
ncbi:MAG: TatD family hydrolase [Gemmatimonadetes bacterium]|nr:TatD family hydrolase [Gemmatimonadota bacterium]